jgi:SAM-dependent methyltransferase
MGTVFGSVSIINIRIISPGIRTDLFQKQANSLLRIDNTAVPLQSGPYCKKGCYHHYSKHFTTKTIRYLQQENFLPFMSVAASSSTSYIDAYFTNDAVFHGLYPASMQSLAKHHWTPLAVAKYAASFLAAEKHARILDIGCGIGKFCLAAAHYMPTATYYGIEQRETLVAYAEAARTELGLDNVHIMHGNFTRLNFKDYDHFYFYNAFYENLVSSDKIDETVTCSGDLFNYYNRYLYKQLVLKPAGTRLATFHSLESEIPPDYHEVGSELDNLLKFWIKV